MEELFFTKIVGTTFCNGQKVIEELEEGDMLSLVKEPTNPYHKNAIAVVNPKTSERIGYIPRNTADSLTRQMVDESNQTFVAFVSEITGQDKDNKGCNISINKM